MPRYRVTYYHSGRNSKWLTDKPDVKLVEEVEAKNRIELWKDIFTKDAEGAVAVDYIRPKRKETGK